MPHDYQRIALNFGGSVAFPSDQGLFIVNGSELKLISANGNLSNNIAMQVAVSAGDGPNKRYLVTSAWDWAPLASWDSGAHWPSWQTKDDGASGSCIGEGGGAYGMGMSNRMLLMHRHNILASSRGGKNRGLYNRNPDPNPYSNPNSNPNPNPSSSPTLALPLARQEPEPLRRAARRYCLRTKLRTQARLALRAERHGLRATLHG